MSATRIPFAKVEGLGNDFVLIDARAQPGWLTAEAAAQWCDRRRGVGADGVLTLLPATRADGAPRMHIYNADGSEPEMCGNGLRCVVAVLGADAGEVRVDTPAGPRSGALLRPGWARTALGVARPGARVDALGVPEVEEAGWVWSLGNPHLVLWTDVDPMSLARAHGARLERHPAFPHGVNVGFARTHAPGVVELVVHERGAGITRACGTGAAAAAATAVATGRAERAVEVRLPGGACRVEVEPVRGAGDDRAVSLEGPARVAFRGELEVSASALRRGPVRPAQRV